MRILIIDDHCDQYHGLVKLMDRRGHETVCCQTIEEGLACYQATEGFDVVVLDLLFPNSQPEQTLRQMNYFGNAKVICVTGVEDYNLRKTAMARGAFDFQIKGASEHSLYDSILKAMAAEHPEDEEIERELFANRQEDAHRRTSFWHRYRGAMAVVATTLSVITLTVALTVGAIRWVYSGGVSDALTIDKATRLKSEFDAEVKSRQEGDQKLVESISVLSKEIATRTTFVDRKLSDLEATDADSKRERKDFGDRLNTYIGDTNTLRREMNEGFVRVQDGQTKLYEILIGRKSPNTTN